MGVRSGPAVAPPAQIGSRKRSHLHHPMPTAAGTPTGRLFFGIPSELCRSLSQCLMEDTVLALKRP